jgi:hypothetical protein
VASGRKRHLTTKDAFSSVAVWQLLVFVLLICFVWASEYLDLSAVVFGTAPRPMDPYRVCVLSAGILTAAIIAVGHTYERQRAMVKRLLMTCLYCHRVMNEDGIWEHVEEYFIRNYPMDLGRGACPACQQMLHSVGASVESAGAGVASAAEPAKDS